MTREKLQSLIGAWVIGQPELLRIMRAAGLDAKHEAKGEPDDLAVLEYNHLVELAGGRAFLTDSGREFTDMLSGLSPRDRAAYFARHLPEQV